MGAFEPIPYQGLRDVKGVKATGVNNPRLRRGKGAGGADVSMRQFRRQEWTRITLVKFLIFRSLGQTG